MNGERVNTLNAIWTMNPNEVTSEMHETFFRQLAKTHLPHLVTDRPQYTIHYKVKRSHCLNGSLKGKDWWGLGATLNPFFNECDAYFAICLWI